MIRSHIRMMYAGAPKFLVADVFTRHDPEDYRRVAESEFKEYGRKVFEWLKEGSFEKPVCVSNGKEVWFSYRVVSGMLEEAIREFFGKDVKVGEGEVRRVYLFETNPFRIRKPEKAHIFIPAGTVILVREGKIKGRSAEELSAYMRKYLGCVDERFPLSGFPSGEFVEKDRELLEVIREV